MRLQLGGGKLHAVKGASLGSAFSNMLILCSCSGMTFGSEWPEACISHFSTGLSAYAPVSFNSTILSVYDLTTQILVDGVSSTTTIANIKSVATGIAIADPVIVGWEEQDLAMFPTEYANSLAQRIGVTLSSETGTTKGPESTGSTGPTGPTHSNRLSTGEKAGLGVGVTIGVVLLALVSFLLYLLRVKKNRPTVVPEGTVELEDQDQHHASRKWFLQNKWRSEAEGSGTPREIDSKTVHAVPGPPVELDG